MARRLEKCSPTARKALVAQHRELFLSQWHAHHHVCENFSPRKFGTVGRTGDNSTECTGMHFYHWGALTGFIGLLEAGF